ncbi:MAG: peptidylprolyl isomerase, partial [Bauldia sp.]|nr:peptidylprolyl isomerase [Bauldia sp.]
MRFKGLLATALVVAAASTSARAQAPNLDDLLYLELDCGRVTILLRPDLAPLTVERIRELARAGTYDGTIFHRVVPRTLAEGGDPTGTGRGGTELPNLPEEFTDEPFVRGTVGMAHSTDPRTGNSRFFVTFSPAPWLNGHYTVFGQVIGGMNCLESIEPGVGADYRPLNPDAIISARIA